jgi:hypothetical protein
MQCCEHNSRELYSQHFVFLVTYKRAQLARVLVPGKPFQPSVMLHSSLIGQFITYKENKVCENDSSSLL